MSQREAFLRAIEANPDDADVRLVFADWLEEHGEIEEGDRQRRYPGSMALLKGICEELNARWHESITFECDHLLEFGRSVAAATSVNIEVSGSFRHEVIVGAIRDRIAEFWSAWAIVTGLPLTPELEQKCYYISGYCCPNEVYADTHIAGPKSPEFLEQEEAHARERREAEQEAEEFQRRLDEEAAERRQREFDAIQERLERDQT